MAFDPSPILAGVRIAMEIPTIWMSEASRREIGKL